MSKNAQGCFRKPPFQPFQLWPAQTHQPPAVAITLKTPDIALPQHATLAPNPTLYPPPPDDSRGSTFPQPTMCPPLVGTLPAKHVPRLPRILMPGVPGSPMYTCPVRGDAGIPLQGLGIICRVARGPILPTCCRRRRPRPYSLRCPPRRGSMRTRRSSRRGLPLPRVLSKGSTRTPALFFHPSTAIAAATAEAPQCRDLRTTPHAFPPRTPHVGKINCTWPLPRNAVVMPTTIRSSPRRVGGLTTWDSSTLSHAKKHGRAGVRHQAIPPCRWVGV